MERRTLLTTVGSIAVSGGCLRSQSETNSGGTDESSADGTSSNTSSAIDANLDWAQYGRDELNSAYIDTTAGPVDGNTITPLDAPTAEGFAIYESSLFVSNRRIPVPIAESSTRLMDESPTYTLVTDDLVVGTGVDTDGGGIGWVKVASQEGELEWETDIEPQDDDISFPMGPPMVKNEILYQNTGDGVLHAFDLTTGDSKWAFDFGSQKEFTPIAWNELVIFSGDETTALSQSGAVEWSQSYSFNSSPVGDENSVYFVGSTSEGSPNGLHALDPTSGAIQWATEVGSLSVQGTRNIAVDDNFVYANTTDHITKLNKSSGEISFQVNAERSGEIVISNDKIFAVGWDNSSGSISAYLKESGEEMWSEIITSPIQSEPIVTENTVYVSADDLYAIHD